MSFKGGNFSFRALTVQNWLRMGKYGTYLEFNTSQEAPKHCPTLDSPTQCFASAHFRSPPVRLQFASSSPPISLRLQFRCASIFRHWFLSSIETIFLKHISPRQSYCGPIEWSHSLQCWLFLQVHCVSMDYMASAGRRSCQGRTQCCELLTCVLVSPTPQVSTDHIDEAVDEE